MAGVAIEIVAGPRLHVPDDALLDVRQVGIADCRRKIGSSLNIGPFHPSLDAPRRAPDVKRSACTRGA